MNAPEWKQIGSVINSQDNTSLTVEFLSEGPEVIGNDYAIDDVAFQEIQIRQFTPVKTASASSVSVGEVFDYTVTLTDTCANPLTEVFFRDLLPVGVTFVPGSVRSMGPPSHPLTRIIRIFTAGYPWRPECYSHIFSHSHLHPCPEPNP